MVYHDRTVAPDLPQETDIWKPSSTRNMDAPSVVALAEVPKPIPNDGEVLIRIHATTVTTGDWRARSLNLPAGFGLFGRLFFGVFGPRKPILGTELAGEVEAVGIAVTRFKVSDEVLAFTGAHFGCHAATGMRHARLYLEEHS
jgi:NADPH:quinone reductase-like Zn-dependent oxidoreductase